MGSAGPLPVRISPRALRLAASTEYRSPQFVSASQNGMSRKTMSLPSSRSGLRHSKLATPTNARMQAVRVCHPIVSIPATTRHAAKKMATCHHVPIPVMSENRSGNMPTSSPRGMKRSNPPPTAISMSPKSTSAPVSWDSVLVDGRLCTPEPLGEFWKPKVAVAPVVPLVPVVTTFPVVPLVLELEVPLEPVVELLDVLVDEVDPPLVLVVVVPVVPVVPAVVVAGGPGGVVGLVPVVVGVVACAA